MGPIDARSWRPDDTLLARVFAEDVAPALLVDLGLTVLHANDACRRYGWEPADIVGRSAFEWIHPDDVTRAIAASKAIAAQSGFGTSPFRFRVPDGSYVSLDVASVLLDGDDEGRPTTVALSLRPNPFDRARTRAFKDMVAGEAPEDALAGLTEWFSPSRPWSLIVFDGAGLGDRTVVGNVPPELAGVFDGRQDHRPGAPWTVALEEMTTVTVPTLDGLPEDVRRAAAARELRTGAFAGTPDPGRPQGALLVAWSDDPDITDLLAVNLSDVETLVRLALDRRASHERLDHLAHHDALTGLANRVRFFTLLEQATPAGSPLAVAYLDLDGFKAVNDRHGHAAGDEVLVELGRRFAREVRAGDVVARLGGDEFGVMLADPRDDATAIGVVERLLTAARAPVDLSSGGQVALGASAGLVVVDDPRGSNPDALVHRADTALYEAKRGAKGTLVLAKAPSTGGPGRRSGDPD